MSRIRRPRRFNRTALILAAGLLLIGITGTTMLWILSHRPPGPTGPPDGTGELIDNMAGGVITVLASLVGLFALTGVVMALIALVKNPGLPADATPRQRLGHIAARLPTGRRLLDLESGRRMWIRQYTTGSGDDRKTDTAVICLDIDEDFAITTTVYTLTDSGANRTRAAAAAIPEDSAVLALATDAGRGSAVSAEKSELDELAAVLDRAVLDTERRRRRRPAQLDTKLKPSC